MAARQNKNTTPDVSTATPDDYRAYADFLAAGNTGMSFADWFASPEGEAQRVAFADQQNAKMRSERMALCKAVWRDIKANSTVATEKGRVAGIALREYLTSLDLENLTTTAADDTTPADATE